MLWLFQKQQDGGRLALFSEGNVIYYQTLWLHIIECQQWILKYNAKEGVPMSIVDLIAVLSFGLACFAIGFAIGRDDNNNSQK